ncbi:MAG: hypothetical protein WB816_10575 [Methylocystis sp.]
MSTQIRVTRAAMMMGDVKGYGPPVVVMPRMVREVQAVASARLGVSREDKTERHADQESAGDEFNTPGAYA